MRFLRSYLAALATFLKAFGLIYLIVRVAVDPSALYLVYLSLVSGIAGILFELIK